jgi:hypothetical protein
VGKGHETYQLVGAQRLDFDDRLEAVAAIRALSRSTRSEGIRDSAV